MSDHAELAVQLKASESARRALGSALREVADSRDALSRVVKALQAERDQLKTDNDLLREEVALDDKLIADRDRLLNMFECPDHGQCIPYAMEQVEALRKDAERYRYMRNGAYCAATIDGYRIICEEALPAPFAEASTALDLAIDAVMGNGEQS